jgi:hypothetical protein
VNIASGTSSGDITISFQDMGDLEWGGSSPGLKQIYINSRKKWTDQTNLISQFPDIYTVILHEMGHMFLGGGHWCSNNTEVMCYSNLQVKRDITSCEQQVTYNFYNPNHTITVTNSFGGGWIRVDSDPNNYTVPAPFTWRESTFPHRLHAIEQSYPEGNQTYIRRFYQWTYPPPSSATSTDRDLDISASDGLYTANFKKEYSIAFVNGFVGVGNAGIIKIRRPGETEYISFTLPGLYPVIQDQTTIEVLAYPNLVNGIEYTFTQWWDGNISAYRTFTPSV